MNRFKHSIEFLRALAMIFVVFGHIPVDLVLHKKEAISFALFINNLFINGTVLFVFISGYLFYHLNRQLNYSDYLMKKVKYVMVPYLFWVTIYFLVKFYFGFVGFPVYMWDPSAHLIKTYLFSVWVGIYVMGPLWFIPMIVLFFLSAPLIKVMLDSKFSTLFMLLFLVVSLVTSRPAQGISLLMPVLCYIHFFGIYFIGGWFSRNGDLIDKVVSYDAVMLVLATAFGASLYQSYAVLRDTSSIGSIEMQLIYQTLDINWFMVQKLLLALLVYAMASRFYLKTNRFVKRVADYSFGVFFIHGGVIYVAFKIYEKLTGSWGADNWTYLPLGASAYIISHFMVYGIKKYAGAKSKYLIGC